MPHTLTMEPIAYIHNDFPTKFGLPRQSGLVETLRSTVVFTPTYREPAALRGLDGFSHVWLVWGFSQVTRQGWSATVRPPRLGGNKRMGVFATRSPFRPNPIGLSCVKLLSVELQTGNGPVLLVGGADLMDGTPIYDIKPYLPYADCRPDATGGFTEARETAPLEVHFAPELLLRIPPESRDTLLAVLARDPRPAYQDDPARIYGFTFAGKDVRFTVSQSLLTVVDVVSLPPESPIR